VAVARIGDREPGARRGHTVGCAADGCGIATVGRHERDLVVASDGATARAHEGVGVGVHEHVHRIRGVRGLVVDGVQLNGLALIDLDRCLLPCTVQIPEANDLSHWDAGKRAYLRASQHHWVGLPVRELRRRRGWRDDARTEKKREDSGNGEIRLLVGHICENVVAVFANRHVRWRAHRPISRKGCDP
jgi:hypothetical protein